MKPVSLVILFIIMKSNFRDISAFPHVEPLDMCLSKYKTNLNLSEGQEMLQGLKEYFFYYVNYITRKSYNTLQLFCNTCNWNGGGGDPQKQIQFIFPQSHRSTNLNSMYSTCSTFVSLYFCTFLVNLSL